MALWRTLVEQDERFADVDWVKEEFNWADSLADEARKLIARLGEG